MTIPETLTLADGRYRLDKCLAAGTGTETWLGRCLPVQTTKADASEAEHSPVIVKLLQLGRLREWKRLELFQREARILHHLNHARIPRLIDHFSFETPQGLCYGIVTEHISGVTLAERRQEQWLPTEAECADLAGQLLGTLIYLHNFQPPVIHRDIKPSNLIINAANRLYLIDFGAVQELLRLEGCGGSTTVGTLGYMAPEQLMGKALPATDLYGLGATLVHLLTGRNPMHLCRRQDRIQYRGFTQGSVAFLDWIDDLLWSDPARRPASAEDALKKLEVLKGRRWQRQVLQLFRKPLLLSELSDATESRAKVQAAWPTPELPEVLLAAGLFAGKYESFGLLGQGSCTRVFKALRLEDQLPVVIKCLSLQRISHWKELELFKREARVLQTLEHASIPRLLDFGEAGTDQQGEFFLVTEAIEGISIQQKLADGWRPTAPEVWDLARQLLEILIYLQSRPMPILHRDIKPSNLILDTQGKLYLIDFGAVQTRFGIQGGGGSTLIGTIGYMAPEQFGGIAQLRTDLYGLGATLIHLLSGCHPADMEHEGLNPRFEAHLQCSASMMNWLRQLLAPNPEQRYQDAQSALLAMQLQLKADEKASVAIANFRTADSAPGLRVLETFCDELTTTGTMLHLNLPLCRIQVSPLLAALGDGSRRNAKWNQWLLRFVPVMLVLFIILLPSSLIPLFICLTVLLESHQELIQFLRKFTTESLLPLATAFAPIEVEWGLKGLTLRQRCDLPNYAPPQEHHPWVNHLLKTPDQKRCYIAFEGSDWQMHRSSDTQVFYAQSFEWKQIRRLTLRRIRQRNHLNMTLYRLKIKSWYHSTEVCFDMDPVAAGQLNACLQQTLEIQQPQKYKPHWQRWIRLLTVQ